MYRETVATLDQHDGMFDRYLEHFESSKNSRVRAKFSSNSDRETSSNVSPLLFVGSAILPYDL